MSLTFLTPFGGLVALAAALPVAAAVIGARRSERVRTLLRLRAPRHDPWALPLLAAVPLLLALAAMQPAVTRNGSERTRHDAAVFVVFDVSRSMLAASSPSAPTRLARARVAAIALRGDVPEVPFGVATLTDRVVPLLFPTSDQAAFNTVARNAVRVNGPPPNEIAPNATDFSALADLGTQSFFSPSVQHRVVVVLTDGESVPFDASSIATGLAGASVVVIRFWHANERVFDGEVAEPEYRPDPASAELVEELASATGGAVFSPSQLGDAADAVRQAAGTGSTFAVGSDVRRTPLAPWIALVSLVPLAVLARRRLLLAP